MKIHRLDSSHWRISAICCGGGILWTSRRPRARRLRESSSQPSPMNGGPLRHLTTASRNLTSPCGSHPGRFVGPGQRDSSFRWNDNSGILGGCPVGITNSANEPSVSRHCGLASLISAIFQPGLLSSFSRRCIAIVSPLASRAVSACTCGRIAAVPSDAAPRAESASRYRARPRGGHVWSAPAHPGTPSNPARSTSRHSS